MKWIILLIGLNLSAQTHIGIEIDPTMLIKENGLDITFTASDDQPILGHNFRIGVILEAYTKRHYYGAGLTLDYPIDFGYYFASIGIEAGKIIRSKVPRENNPETLTLQMNNTYGVNGNIGYWITNDFAITARLNYKRRTDLDRWGMDKFRHSGYLGIKYKLK